MAIKIGKFYITRNNPREILRYSAKHQNIISKLEEWLLHNARKNVGSKESYAQGKKQAYFDTYEKLQKLKKGECENTKWI